MLTPCLDERLEHPRQPAILRMRLRDSGPLGRRNHGALGPRSRYGKGSVGAEPFSFEHIHLLGTDVFLHFFSVDHPATRHVHKKRGAREDC